ncbi:MAG: glycosyltransferase family 4 protein [Spirochaetes bacterium]|nr:glycosyltransferase family 4 protein [Spirochaetota bacterium]
MKKILFISCISTNLYLFRLGLMKKLKEEGFEIIAAAGMDDYTDKLKQEGFKFLPLKVDRKGLNPVKDFLLFIRIMAIIKKEKPDLVLNFTIKPVIYASFCGYFLDVRIMDVITGLGYAFIQDSILKKFIKILYRLALKKADIVIFQNPDDRKYFITEAMVTKPKSFVITSSGVNTGYFSPMKANRDKGVSFLFIGRLLWDKGIGEYLQAAGIVKEKYPDARFKILGWIDKGNPAAISQRHLDKYIQKGIVEYLGYQKDIRPFVAASDVVVLPSYREGVPHSLMEAASMKKPLIATDAVGCREVVEHGKNGLLVPLKDPKALSEAMILLIKRPMTRIKMGYLGRKKMEKEFDEKIVVKKYHGVILKELEEE